MNQIPKQIKRTNKCDKQVKDVVKCFHKKCCSKKSCKNLHKVSGNDLNEWLHKIRPEFKMIQQLPFKDEDKLKICANLQLLMTRNPVVPDIILEEETTRRDSLISLKGIKTVKVTMNENDDEYVVKMKDKKDGMSYKSKFKEDILGHYFRVPFGKLTMKRRRMRMKDVAKLILGNCIDRDEFKSESHLEYLHSNKDLAIEILNLIDGIKEYIEGIMKLKFDDIKDIAMEPLHSDKDGLINELDKNKQSHALAVTMLQETTRNGYTRIRKKINSTAKENEVDLPSYYKITKNRPKILPLDICKMAPIENHGSVDSPSKQEQESSYLLPTVITEDSTVENTAQILLTSTKLEEFNPSKNMCESEELEIVLRLASESTSDSIEGAKIEGGYENHMKLLMEAHRLKGREIKNNEVIVLDSIDGAEHLRSKNRITSVISFSSTIFTSKWLNEGHVSAGSSQNMLTWQQVRGTESLFTMMPAVKQYFEEKRVLALRSLNNASTTKFRFYDLHDGKMLYLLTQHSMWNRMYNPFLLCTCSRGDGVKNNKTHKCRMLTNNDYKVLYERSQKRWDKKRCAVNGTTSKQYTTKNHSDWIDKENSGVSHFGVHPNLLPLEGLRFDTFHLKCAVTRKLMNFIRNFLLQQASDVSALFTRQILRQFYNDYHIYVWNNKTNFASFLGNEIALFVANSTNIINFLKDTLVETGTVTDIITALTCWIKIWHFLRISHLQDMTHGEYEGSRQDFKKNLICFYDAGSRTFLTKAENVGNQETFYLHTLRYYMPVIAETTFKRHQTGVGIFSMQGFERRNKESKSSMNKHSNGTGNILISNMRRLWDKFEYDNEI